MLNKYFNFVKSNANINFLAIPSVKNPRIIVAVKNFKTFKIGLQLHNTASFKNKIIKFFLLINYLLLKEFKSKIISSNALINSLKRELENKLHKENLFFTSFFVGTPNNENRKITAQVSDLNLKPIGILKIPLEHKSKLFISNEFDIINSLLEKKYESILIPNRIFFIPSSKDSVLFEENIFNGLKPVPLKLDKRIVDASLELAIKSLNKNSKEYFQNLSKQIDSLNFGRELNNLFKNAKKKIIKI